VVVWARTCSHGKKVSAAKLSIRSAPGSSAVMTRALALGRTSTVDLWSIRLLFGVDYWVAE